MKDWTGAWESSAAGAHQGEAGGLWGGWGGVPALHVSISAKSVVQPWAQILMEQSSAPFHAESEQLKSSRVTGRPAHLCTGMTQHLFSLFCLAFFSRTSFYHLCTCSLLELKGSLQPGSDAATSACIPTQWAQRIYPFNHENKPATGRLIGEKNLSISCHDYCISLDFFLVSSFWSAQLTYGAWKS